MSVTKSFLYCFSLDSFVGGIDTVTFTDNGVAAPRTISHAAQGVMSAAVAAGVNAAYVNEVAVKTAAFDVPSLNVLCVVRRGLADGSTAAASLFGGLDTIDATVFPLPDEPVVVVGGVARETAIAAVVAGILGYSAAPR